MARSHVIENFDEEKKMSTAPSEGSTMMERSMGSLSFWSDVSMMVLDKSKTDTKIRSDLNHFKDLAKN